MADNETDETDETREKTEAQQDLNDLVRRANKLLQEERLGTKGRDHWNEKAVVEWALRNWQLKHGTPLQQYAARRYEESLLKATPIWPGEEA